MKSFHDSSAKPASEPDNVRALPRQPYHPPSIKVERLSLITRGGTPGAGDSGNFNTEEPPGGSQMESFESGDGSGGDKYPKT